MLARSSVRRVWHVWQVVLSDTVLHCSQANTSARTRRAWMPQVSSGPIRWRASGALVSLAVPLEGTCASADSGCVDSRLV